LHSQAKGKKRKESKNFNGSDKQSIKVLKNLINQSFKESKQSRVYSKHKSKQELQSN